MEGEGWGLSASLGQGQKAPLTSPVWPMPFHSLPLMTSMSWVRSGLGAGGEGPALGALPAWAGTRHKGRPRTDGRVMKGARGPRGWMEA